MLVLPPADRGTLDSITLPDRVPVCPSEGGVIIRGEDPYNKIDVNVLYSQTPYKLKMQQPTEEKEGHRHPEHPVKSWHDYLPPPPGPNPQWGQGQFSSLLSCPRTEAKHPRSGCTGAALQIAIWLRQQPGACPAGL